MSANIYYLSPAQLLSQPTDKESTSASCDAKPDRPHSIVVPEEPLWKLAQVAVSPRIAIIELVIALLVLDLAVAGIITCFIALSHLVQSDAVGHVAARALGAGF